MIHRGDTAAHQRKTRIHTLSESLLLCLSSLLRRSVRARPRQRRLAALQAPYPPLPPQPCSETLFDWIWRLRFHHQDGNRDALRPSRGRGSLLLWEQRPSLLLICGRSVHDEHVVDGVLLTRRNYLEAASRRALTRAWRWLKPRAARMGVKVSSLNVSTHTVRLVGRWEG